MALNQNERQWIEELFNKLNDRVTDIRIDIASLKVKAGIWGLFGGAIPILITVALYIIFK